MRSLLGTAVLALVLPLAAVGPAAAGAHSGHHQRPALAWQERDTPSTESLRGLAAVNRRVAWVAGDDGGIWRTTDGGATWSDVAPPEAVTDALAFRDVQAFGPRRAVVLAIGDGEASRILRTDDAGRTWTTTFVNEDADAFYDCMAFFPGGHSGRQRGLAMSDPVDGKFRILATRNGGRSWRVLPSAGMPEAVDGEFGFAASGTCIATSGRHDAWLGSGGAASRIYHSRDGGRTWTVADAPIPASDAGGVFSLAFRGRDGVAVGGNYLDEPNGVDAAAYTRNGRTFTRAGDPGGYRSGADWVTGSRSSVLAVGPSGSDVSHNGGRTWTTFSDTGFHAVDCVRGACWASGPDGRAARILLPR